MKMEGVDDSPVPKGLVMRTEFWSYGGDGLLWLACKAGSANRCHTPTYDEQMCSVCGKPNILFGDTVFKMFGKKTFGSSAQSVIIRLTDVKSVLYTAPPA
jgi:hypothetical protein